MQIQIDCYNYLYFFDTKIKLVMMNKRERESKFLIHVFHKPFLVLFMILKLSMGLVAKDTLK